MENLSSSYLITLFIFLSIVVFALGVYLGMLFMKLRLQKKQAEHLRKLYNSKLAENEKYFKESILIIAKATIQQQCELSEACIRIKKLLENYPDVAVKEEFQVIQQMYEELSGFDYLESRQQITKQERFKQDNARFKVEEKFNAQMQESLKELVKHFSTVG